MANQFKRLILTSLAVASFSLSAAPSVIPDTPVVAAKAFILVDFDSGKVIAEQNADDSLKPASLTKMMTSYVIGQEIKAGNINLDDEVTISKNAWARNFPDSSKMFIEVGKTVTVERLNQGIIVQSGNDACVAMAEHIAGTESAFAQLMNSWSKQLGMDATHFANSHGLDSKEQYTTARDMATLGQALIRDVPEEYRIYSQKKFTYNGITQYNRNGLLWDKSMNVDGIKTGHTSGAGFNLVSSATKDNMRLVAVVLGTKSGDARKAESKKLLNFGFRFYETVTLHEANSRIVSERVWMGEQEQVELGLANKLTLTVPRGQAKNLTAAFEIQKELSAPIAKGDVVGKVFYNLNDEEIAQADLIALEDVELGSWFSRLIDYFKLLFAGWFG
ncbi:D-alanyl-D-alanine carboxypeptidase family protein [Moritella viscosa]|uniref:D-alanyl-D-alanine carboxypeptidase family protein n=1 Tax=Moritella viscosa TaxID=80854 RepID=UPI00094BF9DC|nr:D-alanyl-D-alanine carboxypeptidase family protein [Moritella viscosa]